MDRPQEELHGLTIAQVLRESVSIPRASPLTFSLITLLLVFPLSLAVLAHSLFTHPLAHRLRSHSTLHDWALLLFYQLLYLLSLFTFSLLATAASVFTVASLFAAKPVSFSATLSAVPPVFSRLFRTFLWVALFTLAYHVAFVAAVVVVLLATGDELSHPGLATSLLLAVVVVFFLAAHVAIAAVWHLASVVTVLEPLAGLAAMKKSRELLKGRGRIAGWLVLGYLAACGVINGAFRAAVVRAGATWARVLVGAGLVAVLVAVNLVGLLVQSVFYYVCKSFHGEVIDRGVLSEHLGGYLGEYVPLKSSIQMENFEL
ncbi:uncharacterized protein LOC144707808 [Wolffia australiana]